MLVRLNKFFNIFRRSVRSDRGQVGIILILIAAIGLILYAAILNLSKDAGIKTLVTISANVTATQLGSLMASYGESLFQTSLGGRRRVCGFTGLFAAIIVVIIIIIIIVISIITVGLGAIVAGGIGTGGFVMLGLALALAVGGAVLQATSVNPGMTKMWNKMMSAALTPEDQFVERGISAGLQSSVTDNAKIPDLYDLDMDTVFGITSQGRYRDQVSRYAYHYTQRLKRAQLPDFAAVQRFKDGLQRFVWVEGNLDWGLYDAIDCRIDALHPCCQYDPQNPVQGQVPAVCNPCCLPEYYPSDQPIPPNENDRIRPECCDNGKYPGGLHQNDDLPPECGRSGPPGNPGLYCRDNSTVTSYGEVLNPYGPSNPYIYEPFYDNLRNSVLKRSFREKIGRDDMHRMYRKSATTPNGAAQSAEPVPPTIATAFYPAYRIEDTTGFHTVTAPTEYTTGVYESLHKFVDWEIDLAAAEASIPSFSNNLGCHWTTITHPDCLTFDNAKLSPKNQRLGALPWPALRSGRLFVDGSNNPPTAPPLRPDKIGSIANLATPNDQCPWGYPAAFPGPGLYKKGTDRFCSVAQGTPRPGDYPFFINEGGVFNLQNSTGWPYYSQCPKHGNIPFGCTDGGVPADCTCDEANSGGNRADKKLWADDSLDEITYGMTDFILFANDIVSRETEDLISTIDTWYPEAAKWIEKAGDPMNYPQDGDLWIWYSELKNWQAAINSWVDGNYAVSDWHDAWCSPNMVAPNGVPTPYYNPAEFQDTQGGQSKVTLDEVVACLQWNVEDPQDGWTGPPVNGNVAKFQNCFTNCSPAACADMPRSLVPNFNPSFTGASPDLAVLQACSNLTPSNTDGCIAAHSGGGGPCTGPVFTNPIYGIPAWNAPNTASINSVRACASCAGQPGTCGPGGVINCQSATVERSFIEAAKCFYGGYGSCCSWGSGITGYSNFPAGKFYDWKLGNTFYNSVMNALGTCPWMSVAGNSFSNALAAAYPIADPSHQQQFLNCVNGCSIFSNCTFNLNLAIPSCESCKNLPQQNGAGVPYNLEPFYDGIAKWPTDSNDMLSFYNCLTGSCNAATCGSLPTVSAGGDSYNIPAFNDPTVAPNPAIRAGYDNCYSCEGNIGGLCGPGAPYVDLQCNNAFITKSDVEASVCFYAGSCCDPWQGPSGPGDTRHYDWAEVGNNYYDAVKAAETIAGGSSCQRVPTLSPYLIGIQQSLQEAQNQEIKFKKRLEVLDGITGDPEGGIVQEEKEFSNTLKESVTNQNSDCNNANLPTRCNFWGFLEDPAGPARGLVEFMKNRRRQPATARQAIYAWQGEVPRNSPPGTIGSWHIVRVDVRIPRRCTAPWNNTPDAPTYCNSGGGDDPQWPYVRTYTKSWGTRRCYELDDGGGDVRGMVKARITRFDESESRAPLRFPGGGLIWKFKFSNPLSGAPNLGGQTTDQYIRSSCGSFMDPEPGVLPDPPQIDGAFLLDCASPNNSVSNHCGDPLGSTIACWNAVNTLLKHGVTSEACTEYYWRAGTRPGFNIKFVECKKFY